MRQLGTNRVRVRLNILKIFEKKWEIFEDWNFTGSERSHVKDFSGFFGFFDSFLNSLPLSIWHHGKHVRMMRFNWTKHFSFRKIFEDILFFFRIFTFWIGIVWIIVWIKHFIKKLLTAENLKICFDFRKFVIFRIRTKSESSGTIFNVIYGVFQIFDEFSTKSKIANLFYIFLKYFFVKKIEKIQENFGQIECAIQIFESSVINGLQWKLTIHWFQKRLVIRNWPKNFRDIKVLNFKHLKIYKINLDFESLRKDKESQRNFFTWWNVDRIKFQFQTSDDQKALK